MVVVTRLDTHARLRRLLTLRFSDERQATAPTLRYGPREITPLVCWACLGRWRAGRTGFHLSHPPTETILAPFPEPLRAFAFGPATEAAPGDDDSTALLKYLGRRADWTA